MRTWREKMTKNTPVCSTKLDQTRHHLSNQATTAEDIYILGNVYFWSKHIILDYDCILFPQYFSQSFRLGKISPAI